MTQQNISNFLNCGDILHDTIHIFLVDFQLWQVAGFRSTVCGMELCVCNKV